MNTIDLHVKGNGFFVFNPAVFRKRYNGIQDGTNLLEMYTQTDEGDDVVKAGAMLPIFNIPEIRYKIILCKQNDSVEEKRYIWKRNGRYPLISSGELCISNMDILADWNNQEIDKLTPVTYESGFLSFEVNLFVKRGRSGEVLSYGYLLNYQQEDSLIELTADLEESMVL